MKKLKIQFIGLVFLTAISACDHNTDTSVEWNLTNADVNWSGDTLGLNAMLSESAKKFIRNFSLEKQRVCLKALENQEQFEVAHVLLTIAIKKEFLVTESHWNGLEVAVIAGKPAIIDPEQIPRLVEFWCSEQE